MQRRAATIAMLVGTIGSAQADVAQLTTSARVDELPAVDVVRTDPPTATVPRLVLGAPGNGLTLRRLDVEIEPRVGAIALHLTLTVESDVVAETREVLMPLTMPAGTRVTEGALRLGNEPRVVATAVASEQARAEFLKHREVVRDPLLVEATGTDVYQLRAFPLRWNSLNRIELTVELPPMERVMLDLGGQRLGMLKVSGNKTVVRNDVERAQVIHLPSALVATELPTIATASIGPPLPPVTPALSLYAGAPDPRARIVALPAVASTVRYGAHIDKTMIRRRVKLARERMTECYNHVVQFGRYEDAEQGELTLHFAIAPSGSIADVSVDGELQNAEVRSCLVEVAKSWEFPAGDATVVVNYPLRFQLYDY